MKTKRNFKYYYFLLGVFLCLPIYAQNTTSISGTVTDETGMPLPGVSIIIKNTTTGTTTDFDGNYSVNVASIDILVFSYMGYKTKEITVGKQLSINISMEEEAGLLDEVVVVGYGTVKKSDLTGSVGTLDAESLTERNLTNPLESIQGNVAGVQINNSTGRLGDGFDITIRGQSSIAGGEPLYVVDGVPTDGIDFLNPQDIAQIDVLKDASSTAIYGSRGSNGVVIVTTKSGSSAKGSMNVTFDTFFGVKEVARLPEMMDGEKWWYYHRSAYLATASDANSNGIIDPAELFTAYGAGGNPLFISRAENNDTFNWYDAVLKSGIQQNNYLSITGRADNGVAYNFGLGYQRETGNIENEELDKYTLKLGVNHKINDKFSTGANFTVALSENQLGSNLAMREAFRLNPFLSPWAVDDNGNEIVGELFPQPGKLTYPTSGDFAINKTSTFNPLLEIANSSDKTRRWNAIGTIYFQYQPIKWLSFKTTFSPGLDTWRQGLAWGALTNVGISNNNLPSAEIIKSENFSYTWDNQFNIDYTFNKDHNVKFLGLQSLYSNRIETSFASSRNQPFDTGFYNLGSGSQSSFNLGTNYIKQTLSSFAARLNYSYKDKYLITLSNRWDGSSLFTEDNRWDSFPSGAIAWKISGEDFMSDSKSISNLKLRVGYGFTGNNVITPYSTLNTLDLQTFYDFNGSVATGFLPSSIANTLLSWEKTKEWNFGLDFGFINNRISGSIDVYNRLSEDLLSQQQLPRETGYEFINANVSSVRNKGVEIGLNTRVIQKEDVSWEVNLTYTNNTNTIESLYGQNEVDDVGNGWFIGESIDAHYNYIFDGIWQASQASEASSYGQSEGQAKVVDVNNDGRIDPDDDRVILGSSDPDWTGSLFTKLRVKNFDISASIITNQGSFVYSPFHANFTDVRDRGRQKQNITWYVPENDAGLPAQYSNKYPQPRNTGTYWRNNGVGYYKDASFVKVKNISLGYNFNDKIVEQLKIKKLRVYANILNPFVFTDYDGYDPEWASADLETGRVAFVTYQLGLSVKF
ncbi:MAG: SusC/RagA family TonB-linked outer membrane protein [Aestuariibaculum sp.]